MSYLVLARKFRPQVLEDVLGQPHVTQTLRNALKSGRVAHAYLFSGPRGVGKTSVARILAKCLNCQEGPTPVPCNRCPSCREITQGSSLDVFEIDGASNRGIDDVRELRENIKYLPVQGRKKVYIIDEVHMLTGEAFNALLKTLEEPPSHAVFILATTELNRVPLTIHSRCQSFSFRRIAPEVITEHLARLIGEEQIPWQEEALHLLARQAEGSLRDALSLLDQILSYSPPEISLALIQDQLGLVGKETLERMVRAILAGKLKEVIEGVGEIYEAGFDLKVFYRDLVEAFRILLLIRLGAESGTLLPVSGGEFNALRETAAAVSLDYLQDGLHFLIQSEGGLRRSEQPRLALELALLRLIRLKEIISIDALLERLEELRHRWPPGGEEAFPEREVPVAELKEEQRGYTPGGESAEPDPAEAVELNGEETVPPHTAPRDPEPAAGDLEALMAYIRREALPLAIYLENGRLRRTSEDTLEWDFGENTFNLTLMESNGNQTRLEKLCQDFFRKKIKVRLVGGAAPTPGDRKAASNGPKQKKRKLVKETLENPQLREILTLFQGDVVEVKTPD